MGGRERETEREKESGDERKGKALVPWYELKMEPVSALHDCVLEMTLKSCNQAAGPRLLHRGNSEERDGGRAAPAVC